MIRRFLYLPLFVLAGFVSAYADNIAFNGFETDTGDWSFDASGQVGDGNGNITQTASGGGPLGLTAFDGSYYATVQANTDGYSTGFANGGSSFFGFDSSTPAYPGSAFSQDISVYINVNTPAPTDPSTPAFWIDDSPSSTSPSDAGSGGLGYGGEHNFQLSYTGSSVLVNVDGGTQIATLTTSGWYTFQMIYAMGPTDTSLATTTLNILDSDNNLMGTDLTYDDSNSDPLESQYLAGPGYVWIAAWQNGFSDDYLGIDDVRADTVAPTPEPAGQAAICAGFVLLGCFVRARRQRGRIEA